MSEKIKYQFSAIPAEWLTSFKLSAQEKVILGVLILKGNDENISALGYEELGRLSGISRRQCINLIDKLEKNGYIERIIVNNRRFATAIRVCLENVGGQSQGGFGSAIECTPETNRGATGSTPEKKQECNLKQTGVQFKANGSAIQFTLNRSFKNSRNTRAGAREETETADGAAVRSMPNAGQAGGTVQQGNQARFDLSDLNDCRCCLESIQGASDFNFLKSGKYLLFRPKGKFAKVTDEIKNNITTFFSDKCGKMIFFVDADKFYLDEQKIV